MLSKLSSPKSAGFALIEVMVGITLITIVLIPVLTYFANGVRFVHQSEIRSQALDLARKSIERIKAEAAKNWDNLNNYCSTFSLSTVAQDNDPQAPDYYDLLANDYNITVSLPGGIDVNGDGVADCEELIVTVTWDNASKSVRLETLIAKR